MACQIDLKAVLHSYIKSNPYKARGRVPRSDTASNTGFKFSMLLLLPNTVSPPKAPVPQAQVPNVIFAIFYLLLIGCCKGKTILATST